LHPFADQRRPMDQQLDRLAVSRRFDPHPSLRALNSSLTPRTVTRTS
jgi:hypothetical protein